MMDNMKKIIEFIEKNHMIQQGDRIIVGVSGGADSVCLLFTLLKLKNVYDLTLIVVHIEHGLRGEESIQDARFVERLAKREGLLYRQHSCNITAIAKEEKISEEEAGRKARYTFFRAIKEELKCQKIAVAHNQNDQSETILFHLLRGSGLRGMRGMEPVSGEIIRPLLDTSRREIEGYLVQWGETYRQDKTNFETDYTRNKIRLDLLPRVEQMINPKAIEHIAEFGKAASEAEEYLEEIALNLAKEMVMKNKPSGIVIDTKGLLGQKPIISKYVIRVALKEYVGHLKDITSHHIESLLELGKMDVGKSISLPGNLQAVKGYRSIVIERAREVIKEETIMEEVPLKIPGITSWGTFQFSTCIKTKEEIEKERITQNRCTKFFDYDTIKIAPCVRSRRSGDFIVIDKEGRKKKLKEYLIHEKIPRTLRDTIPVLALGSQLLWIGGYRMGENYRPSEETEKILVISMKTF